MNLNGFKGSSNSAEVSTFTGRNNGLRQLSRNTSGLLFTLDRSTTTSTRQIISAEQGITALNFTADHGILQRTVTVNTQDLRTVAEANGRSGRILFLQSVFSTFSSIGDNPIIRLTLDGQIYTLSAPTSNRLFVGDFYMIDSHVLNLNGGVSGATVVEAAHLRDTSSLTRVGLRPFQHTMDSGKGIYFKESFKVEMSGRHNANVAAGNAICIYSLDNLNLGVL